MDYMISKKPLSNSPLLTVTDKYNLTCSKGYHHLQKITLNVVSRSQLPKILEYRNLRSPCPDSSPEPDILEIGFLSDILSFFHPSRTLPCELHHLTGKGVELCVLTGADNLTS